MEEPRRGAAFGRSGDRSRPSAKGICRSRSRAVAASAGDLTARRLAFEPVPVGAPSRGGRGGRRPDRARVGAVVSAPTSRRRSEALAAFGHVVRRRRVVRRPPRRTACPHRYEVPGDDSRRFRSSRPSARIGAASRRCGVRPDSTAADARALPVLERMGLAIARGADGDDGEPPKKARGRRGPRGGFPGRGADARGARRDGGRRACHRRRASALEESDRIGASCARRGGRRVWRARARRSSSSRAACGAAGSRGCRRRAITIAMAAGPRDHARRVPHRGSRLVAKSYPGLPGTSTRSACGDLQAAARAAYHPAAASKIEAMFRV